MGKWEHQPEAAQQLPHPGCATETEETSSPPWLLRAQSQSAKWKTALKLSLPHVQIEPLIVIIIYVIQISYKVIIGQKATE